MLGAVQKEVNAASNRRPKKKVDEEFVESVPSIRDDGLLAYLKFKRLQYKEEGRYLLSCHASSETRKFGISLSIFAY